MATRWAGLRRVGGAATLAMAGLLAGCGGGAEVTVGGPVLGVLAIGVAQVGPNAVRVDWSDDPYVADFTVYRDGFVLAEYVDALSLIDASVRVGNRYCYHVDGYDVDGQWVAASDTVCLTVVP